ncbi:MAG: flagellar protein FliJ [Clostridia bacterium]|jgi:flagellar FliJ protein|nr:flagellar export protein FliJ [Clostridiales bacterium]MDK2985132.1 flagellar protein FliJ [Clostridia bacterium]
MQKFKFNLENVLKYRESIEEQQKEQLASSIRRVQAEKKFLNDLLGQKKNALSFANSNPGAVNVIMLQHNETYHSFLNARIEMQRKKLRDAQNLVKKHRLQLAEAAKKRKIMESLKEKYMEEYQKTLGKEEQKNLDEAGIAAYCRKAE